MSRLLKQTILDNNKEKMEKIKSDNNFFDAFTAERNEKIDFKNINIKIRSSVYYKSKCLNKVHEDPKYKGKIIFPIIETILVDKGQVNYWLFTEDSAGYVLKRNSIKLKKDNILKYFVKAAREIIIETTEDSERKLDRIIEDIHRYLVLSDQNYNNTTGYGINEDMLYLEPYKKKNFIFLKMAGDVEKFINVFDLFIYLGDSNKLTSIMYMQNFAYIDSEKLIYCKFSRKNSLAPKHFQIFTKIPQTDIPLNINNDYNNIFEKNKSLPNAISSNNITGNQISTTNVFNNPENNKFNANTGHSHTHNMNRTQKRTINKKNLYDDDDSKNEIGMEDLIALKDNILTEHLATISEPFVELLEKIKEIFVYEAFLIFVKDQNGNLVFKQCDNVLCKSRKTPEEIEEEDRIKSTMKQIHERTIPKEIRKNVKIYEKVSKNAFCFGEFCKYQIPKYFKNMNKITKEEINELNSKQTKISERVKNHDFAFWIPFFLIKKSHDNEYLVNTLLKAYSIFPENFNKDQVLLDLQKQKMLEDQKKEEENKKEEERIKLEEKNKRLGPPNNEGKIRTKNSSVDNNNFEEDNKKKDLLETLNLEMNDEDDDVEKLKKEKEEEERDTIILYKPTPGKFANFNFDKMYSKTNVCANCNIIYMLIENIFKNFEDGENQIKSLNKAKISLLRGEKLRNHVHGDNGDNDDNNDNLLFREQKSNFSLKKILKQKFLEEKRRKEEANKPFVHQKIRKKVITKREENEKLFNYEIKINPKFLQLNLLAEKSKNKFFNLILDELKSQPKSINEKMGLDKPKNNYPKNLESLRMHMGLNSKIRIDSEYKDILKQNGNNRKTSSLGPNECNLHHSNNSITNKMDISAYNIEINIFQEYMKMKSNFKPHLKKQNSQGRNSNTLKEIKENDNSILKIPEENTKENQNLFSNEIEEFNKKPNIKEEEEEENEQEANDSVKNYEKDYWNKNKKDNKRTSLMPREDFRNKISRKYSFEEEKKIDYKRKSELFIKKSNLANNLIEIIKSKELKENDGNGNNEKNLEEKKNNNFTDTLIKIINHFVEGQEHLKKINKNKNQNIVKEGLIRLEHVIHRYHHDEIFQSKNYDSDFDHEKMQKFVYEKLEKTNKEIILNGKKKTGIFGIEDFLGNTEKEKKKKSKKNEEKSNEKDKKDLKTQEFSKKAQINSIFHYDWAKDPNKYGVPYYYMSTPLMRLNENNLPVYNNPLDETKTITFEDFYRIGKFNNVFVPRKYENLYKKCRIFVHDQFTAVPYIITDLKTNENVNAEESLNDTKFKYSTINNNSSDSGNKPKIIVLVLNDFFDCFTNYYDFLVSTLGPMSEYADKFKIVSFNFPGQPMTLFNKKNTFNNMYFSKFTDRFLYHLLDRNVFDHTYSLILIGFGNGGNVALNFTAANEKFFDFINSVILLNSFCENDENVGKSMLEVNKVIENSKNESMIDFFLKSITFDPSYLNHFNNQNLNKQPKVSQFDFEKKPNNLPYNSEVLNKIETLGNSSVLNDHQLKVDDSQIKLSYLGYSLISKGYFYNIPFNHKEITTPIVAFHTSNNCFIPVTNVTNLFNNKDNSNVSTNNTTCNNFASKDTKPNFTPSSSIDDFSELNPENKVRRKLVVVDGAHNLMKQDQELLTVFFMNFFEYSFENTFHPKY